MANSDKPEQPPQGDAGEAPNQQGSSGDPTAPKPRRSNPTRLVFRKRQKKQEPGPVNLVFGEDEEEEEEEEEEEGDDAADTTSSTATTSVTSDLTAVIGGTESPPGEIGTIGVQLGPPGSEVPLPQITGQGDVTLESVTSQGTGTVTGGQVAERSSSPPPITASIAVTESFQDYAGPVGPPRSLERYIDDKLDGFKPSPAEAEASPVVDNSQQAPVSQRISNDQNAATPGPTQPLPDWDARPDAPATFSDAGGLGDSGGPPTPPNANESANAQPPRRPLRSAADYPDFQNDNPTATDSLGMTDDAKAFARLAASIHVPPPLAVGLFGQWGSGKSFFMEKIQAEVAKLSPPPSNASRTAETGDAPAAAEAKPHGPFHKSVVQIRFNAWHYQESNLWASLVGHIFHELANETSPARRDSVLGQLATARSLTLEAATTLVQALREHSHAEETFEVAKKDLARAEAEEVSSPRFFVRVLKDVFKSANEGEINEARAKLNEVSKELGLPDAVDKSNQLTDAGLALMRDGIDGLRAVKAIASGFGSVRSALLLLLLVGGIPFLMGAGLSLLLNLADDYFREAKSVLVGVGTTATALISLLNQFARPISIANGKLKMAQSIVENHIAKHRATFEERLEKRQAIVTKARADVDAAREVLQAASTQLSRVRETLHGQTPANRLIEFIQARAADGDYAKHLGIISTIRKDFEQLSSLLSPTAEDALNSAQIAQDLARFEKQIDAVIAASCVPVAKSPPPTVVTESQGGNLTSQPVATAVKDELHEGQSPGAVVASVSMEQGPSAADGDGAGHDKGLVHRKRLLSDADIAQLKELTKPIDAKEMPFTRIILYIDDVDRCPPAKVVEVLQAVHMLLAFNLFVVFVAVDVEWVGSSLAHQYKNMLKDLNSDQPLTSAAVYLEKIFQVPYWLPSVTADSAKSLILSLNPLEAAALPTSKGPKSHFDMAQKAKEPAPQPELPEASKISLTAFEVGVLQEYSEIIDTPRKMKRLVNVLRFAKVRGHLPDVPSGEEDTEEASKVRALIALTTLATASPDDFSHFRYYLQRMDVTSTVEYADGLRSKDFLHANPTAARLAHLLNKRGALEASLEHMGEQYALAARFSFVVADKRPVHVEEYDADFVDWPTSRVRDLIGGKLTEKKSTDGLS